ncbi:MAG: glutamate-cysteine ligase family protein [Gammaproteobacteria bacterium]|nr:glutamate-cysteine ligase family protein [Gammaproteobacteria bacterium]
MGKYALFSVIGIELEYMIVDQLNLNIQPKSDELIKAICGELTNECELDDHTSISNELVLHVLEFKNHDPQPATPELITQFHQAIQKVQPFLRAENLCLLPTASHPWMNPHTETRRWPHDNHDIYQTYDQIFNCQGHGWSNLQSMHINLPFANDTEFNLLHNAIRLLLPLLPAIGASSPIHDGVPTGDLDARLRYYNTNQTNIPLISGHIIPEFIQNEADYHQQILQPMYQEIRPFDPNNILQFEWLNSRGAIPKFDYNAIEIRVLDTQECVRADLSIALAVNHILKSWQQEPERYLNTPIDTLSLKQLYLDTIKDGLNARIHDRNLLTQWGLPHHINTCREAWAALISQNAHHLDMQCQQTLDHILTHGNLSERILNNTGQHPSLERLKHVYRDLAACLLDNRLYH